MSKKRASSLNQYPVKMYPNGTRGCRWCGKVLDHKSRTFCGKECVHQYMIRSRPGYAADQVAKRDAGVCAKCGVDTVVFHLEAYQRAEIDTPPRYRGWRRADDRIVPPELVALGWPKTFNRRWFDVEHVIPVVDGGGECGLENLISLCVPCHKRATAALAARRALDRKQAKETRPEAA